MQKFQNLLIYQKSLAFVTRIYQLTNNFPSHEQFGLTSQIRRASVSISLNIAEGCGNHSRHEFARFLLMSLRSTYEVIAALEISKRLNYFFDATLVDEANEIAAMTNSLIKKLKTHD